MTALPLHTDDHVYAQELTSAQRARLKGLAHALRPVVQIGSGGLSPNVIREIAQSLETHELVKIQLPGQNDASGKMAAAAELAQALPPHTHLVARVGRTLIVYLEKNPKIARLPLRGERRGV